jgi:hypothetical protein
LLPLWVVKSLILALIKDSTHTSIPTKFTGALCITLGLGLFRKTPPYDVRLSGTSRAICAGVRTDAELTGGWRSRKIGLLADTAALSPEARRTATPS